MTQRVSCLIAGIAALASACAQEQPMRIRCELSMPQTVTSTQPAELVFALTNEGKDTVRALNWQTPFEGVRAPMFDVRRDGVELEYRGRMVKRAAPAKEAYLELQPGERKEAKIDLADGWDVAAPGRYTVSYAAELFDVVDASMHVPRALDELAAMPLSCRPVTFVRQP
jgi:peptidyl-Lys metalloendopeptidase